MASISVPKSISANLQQQVMSQFRGLNPNDPSSWPLVPRLALNIALMVLIVGVLWFVWRTPMSRSNSSAPRK